MKWYEITNNVNVNLTHISFVRFKLIATLEDKTKDGLLSIELFSGASQHVSITNHEYFKFMEALRNSLYDITVRNW